MTTILYDAECPLCKMLAEYAHDRSGAISYQSWQSFCQERGVSEAAPSADQVRVLVDGSIYAGAEAWAVILREHPHLKSLSWLAEKIGMTRPLARVFNRSGHLLRRFCRHCGTR